MSQEQICQKQNSWFMFKNSHFTYTKVSNYSCSFYKELTINEQ